MLLWQRQDLKFTYGGAVDGVGRLLVTEQRRDEKAWPDREPGCTIDRYVLKTLNKSFSELSS